MGRVRTVLSGGAGAQALGPHPARDAIALPLESFNVEGRREASASGGGRVLGPPFL
jgi:hypothetical protein